jgi:hypothetical protein
MNKEQFQFCIESIIEKHCNQSSQQAHEAATKEIIERFSLYRSELRSLEADQKELKGLLKLRDILMEEVKELRAEKKSLITQ